MKWFMDVLFFVILGYYIFDFIQLLVKMKQEVFLPVSETERTEIRRYPEKTIDFPIYKNQGTGIIVYSILLMFLTVVYFLGLFILDFDWSLYLLVFLPLINSKNLLNQFAVVEDGLLISNRFVAWKKIKSFHFLSIDKNHRFYGFSKEVNIGFELKIKTGIFSESCIVTSINMKEKLTEILKEHVQTTKREKETLTRI